MGWDGEARGPAGAPSHRTRNYAAAFSLAQRSAFALEPNAVARPAVRHDAADDDTQRTGTTKQTQQQGQRQGNGQRSSRGRARQDKTDNSETQSKQHKDTQNSSTANDRAGDDGDWPQTRAVTDTPLGVSYTRRKERHRPQPEWRAGHIFTRIT